MKQSVQRKLFPIARDNPFVVRSELTLTHGQVELTGKICRIQITKLLYEMKCLGANENDLLASTHHSYYYYRYFIATAENWFSVHPEHKINV